MRDYIPISAEQLDLLAQQDLAGIGYADCGMSFFKDPEGRVWPDLDTFALRNIMDEIFETPL